MGTEDLKVSITYPAGRKPPRSNYLAAAEAAYRLYDLLGEVFEKQLEVVRVIFYESGGIDCVQYRMALDPPSCDKFWVEATKRDAQTDLSVRGDCDYGSVPVGGHGSPEDIADALRESLRVAVVLHSKSMNEQAEARRGNLAALETALTGGWSSIVPSDFIEHQL